MLCDCGSDTKVVDSRLDKDSIRRRRECLECARRFSTLEKKVEPKAQVVPVTEAPKEKAPKRTVVETKPAASRAVRWDDDDAVDISDTRYGGELFRREQW